MENNQKTLKDSIEFNGVGLHTGEKVCMVINPANENHGIKFQRIDLPEAPIIPADIDLVKDTQRSTTLELNNVKIIIKKAIIIAIIKFLNKVFTISL